MRSRQIQNNLLKQIQIIRSKYKLLSRVFLKQLKYNTCPRQIEIILNKKERKYRTKKWWQRKQPRLIVFASGNNQGTDFLSMPQGLTVIKWASLLNRQINYFLSKQQEAAQGAQLGNQNSCGSYEGQKTNARLYLFVCNNNMLLKEPNYTVQLVLYKQIWLQEKKGAVLVKIE